MTRKIKMRIDPYHGSTVEIDGKPMPGLTNIEVGHKVGEPSWVRLTFIGYDVDVEGEVGDVTMQGAPQ